MISQYSLPFYVSEDAPPPPGSDLEGNVALLAFASRPQPVRRSPAYVVQAQYWLAGSGSFDGSLDGTSSLTFDASSPLQATRELAGTASLTFGASSSLDATRELSGTATLTFSASSNIEVTRDLAGASSLTFDASSILESTREVAGTSSLTFGASSTVEATRELAGDSSLTFSASGALQDFEPAGLAGNVALLASITAPRRMRRPLSYAVQSDYWIVGYEAFDGSLDGTSSLTFGASAGMEATRELSGASSLVFGASGALQDSEPSGLAGNVPLLTAAQGPRWRADAFAQTVVYAYETVLFALADSSLDGTSSLTFGASGELNATRQLSGASSLVFAATATLEAVRSVAGTSSLAFGATGALQSDGELAGSASLEFFATAELTATRGLTGAPSLTFAATGELAATRDLTAASSLTFAASSGLLASRNLAGATSLAFAAAGALQPDAAAAYSGRVVRADTASRKVTRRGSSRIVRPQRPTREVD